MRLLTSAIVLSLMLGTSTLAYADPEDAAKAPDAKEKSAPADTTPATADTAPEHFAEPNLKLPKDSGGKSSSSLIKDAPLSTDYVMGKPTAPLIMIEYASMSCPHCGHFSNAILPELEKKYVDTGAMRYILRQFPLNEPALKAAELLSCVGEQDQSKYYVFAKVLFDAQSKWAFDTNYMSGLETIASVGGVTKDQFQSCENDTRREAAILKLKKAATDDLKVPHTPYIFVGDEAYEGERTVEAMSKFIDKKLSEIKAAAPK